MCKDKYYLEVINKVFEKLVGIGNILQAAKSVINKMNDEGKDIGDGSLPGMPSTEVIIRVSDRPDIIYHKFDKKVKELASYYNDLKVQNWNKVYNIHKFIYMIGAKVRKKTDDICVEVTRKRAEAAQSGKLLYGSIESGRFASHLR